MDKNEITWKIINESKKDATIVYKNNNSCNIVEIEYPSYDFETVRNLKHDVILKNDVYQTANVEFNIECQVKTKSVDEKIFNNECSYEFCSESYEEYIKSVPIVVENDENTTIIYEDNDFKIISLDLNNLYGKFFWKCIFKNSKIFSIRELDELENLIILKSKIQELFEKHGITNTKSCLYFNYLGKCSHLILNVVDISEGYSCIHSKNKFIFFADLIKNITIDKNYYKRNIILIKENKCI